MALFQNGRNRYSAGVVSDVSRGSLARNQRSFLSTGGLVRPARKKSSKANPVTALVPPGSPLHWYDMSDLDTLFQDVAASTPVTAHGQSVGRVNNKGSLTSEYLANAPEDSTRPTYDDQSFAYAGVTGDGSQGLDSTTTTWPGVSMPWAIGVVFATGTNNSDILMRWQNNNTAQVFRSATAKLDARSSGEILVTTASVVDDTMYSVLFGIDGTNFDATFSLESGTQTVAPATPVALSDSTTDGWMGESDSPSFGWQGTGFEFVVWGVDPATILTEWQTYTTAKWGITWA